MLKTNSVHAYLRNKLPASSSAASGGGLVNTPNLDLSSPALPVNSNTQQSWLNNTPGWSYDSPTSDIWQCNGTGGLGFPASSSFSQFMACKAPANQNSSCHPFWSGYLDAGSYVLTCCIARGSSYSSLQVFGSCSVKDSSGTNTTVLNDYSAVPAGGWSTRSCLFVLTKSGTTTIAFNTTTLTGVPVTSWLGIGGISLYSFAPPVVTGNYSKNSLNGKSIVNGGYTGWIFTSGSNNTFTVSAPCTLQILCVGGGGGSRAGGSGGGGFVQSTATLTSADTLTISVGNGGYNWYNAPLAEPSLVTFANNPSFSVTALGGGKSGGNGGSGGGGGSSPTFAFGNTGGTGTPGQGNNGGNAPAYGSGGGGGGAGSAGKPGSTGNGTNVTSYLSGGAGKACTLPGFNTSIYFAGGGGGMKFDTLNGSAGNGGIGGGGGGCLYYSKGGSSYTPGTGDSNSFYTSGSSTYNRYSMIGGNGAQNSGGGAGGTSGDGGGSGDSGVVVVVVQGTY